MKYIILDGNMIQSKDHLHDILARELELPEYYGRNLDALHDCLTELHTDTVITAVNFSQLPADLQLYADRLLRVLRDSAEETAHLHINVI